MDEVNQNGKPERAKVLRATDVIPPFDQNASLSNSVRTNAKQPEARPPDTAGNGGDAESCLGPTHTRGSTGRAPVDCVEIPTYDLAANILAEQRRAAGRRRRAPGQTEDGPVASARGADVKVSISDAAAPDLSELQRVVAEIVARDIERLCRRPGRLADVRR